MFKDAWAQRAAQTSERRNLALNEVKKIDAQIAGLLDRIVDASSKAVVGAYEARIEKLEHEKLLMIEKVENHTKPRYSFDELFELALEFLSSPCKIWNSGNLAMQRIVLRLAFFERLSYCRKTGLRTPQIALPFKALDGFQSGKCKMARPKGFEPLTPRFVVWCSIQLSYGRICNRQEAYCRPTQ